MKPIANILFLLSFFFVNSSSPVFSQNFTLDNVLYVSPRNFGAIIEGDQVKGYYGFYKVDKLDKKTNSYLLEIYDENLKKTGSKTFTDSKYLFLQEVAFNGQSIMLKFYESKEKQVMFRKLGRDGTLQAEKAETVGYKQEAAYYNTDAGDSEIRGSMLFAVSNRGFINYTVKQFDKLGFTINFIAENKDEKGWEYSSPKNSSDLHFATYIGKSENLLLSSVSKSPKLLSKDHTYYLLANDLKTGEKVYETKLADSRYVVEPINGYVDEKTGETILLGLYSN